MQKQVHDALLDLVVSGIKDEGFVAESALYGQELLCHAVTQSKVLDASKDLLTECSQDEGVIDGSVDLCKWLVVNP